MYLPLSKTAEMQSYQVHIQNNVFLSMASCHMHLILFFHHVLPKFLITYLRLSLQSSRIFHHLRQCVFVCDQLWHTYFDHVLYFIVMLVNSDICISARAISFSDHSTFTFSPSTFKSPQIPQIGHSTCVVPFMLKSGLWQTGHTPSSPTHVSTSSYGFQVTLQLLSEFCTF